MTVHDLRSLPNSTAMRVEDVSVPERLRPIDTDYVSLLAGSIAQQGLQTPIVVRLVGNRHVLVAGAHRLAAARALGWAYISVTVRTLSDAEARLVEIDENLVRRELNALDRAVFLLERKTVYEALNPQTRHGGGSKSQTLRHTLGLDGQRFTKDVADKVGLSERAVQLAIQMAARLDPEAVAAIRGTSFAGNQAALLKLSQEPPAKQRTLALQLRDGKARTLDAARVAAGFQQQAVDDPQARHLATLLETWVKADAATRAAFLQDIGASLGKGTKR